MHGCSSRRKQQRTHSAERSLTRPHTCTPATGPKFQAAGKRAVLFARAQQAHILWVRAIDVPTTNDDQSFTKGSPGAAT